MKKTKIYRLLTPAILLGMIIGMGLFSCEEYPNAYKHTDGVPEVLYVRVTDPLKADSLLDGAFMGNVICIVGNNLRSIHELYFNDQLALLNTSYITDHTLIVTIPNRIPVDVTDKMYLVTYDNKTVSYDFKIKVPGPTVNSMSCEYIQEGSEAIIYGDYFLDDPNIPLEIQFAGNLPVKEIISIEKTQIKFIVPEGASKGYVTVKSLYGTGRSKFQYKDDRGMILDWDNLDASGGWRSGKTASEGGISGKYVIFKGTVDNGAWNSEDDVSFNLWGTSNGRPQGDFFDAKDLKNLLLKFEINVLEAWTCCAMQIIFTSWGTSGTNGYYSQGDYPRGLWLPWTTTGSYKTDGWVTITIPLSEFKYSRDGAVLETNGEGFWGGLSMFIYAGGVNGTKCTTEMWIDNIRVVPVDK
jgi:hypothetical protein